MAKYARQQRDKVLELERTIREEQSLLRAMASNGLVMATFGHDFSQQLAIQETRMLRLKKTLERHLKEEDLLALHNLGAVELAAGRAMPGIFPPPPEMEEAFLSLIRSRGSRQSKRAGKPFVAVDCGAIPRDLAASEFFGHVKGLRHHGRVDGFDGQPLYSQHPPQEQRRLYDRKIEEILNDKDLLFHA